MNTNSNREKIIEVIEANDQCLNGMPDAEYVADALISAGLIREDVPVVVEGELFVKCPAHCDRGLVEIENFGRIAEGEVECLPCDICSGSGFIPAPVQPIPSSLTEEERGAVERLKWDIEHNEYFDVDRHEADILTVFTLAERSKLVPLDVDAVIKHFEAKIKDPNNRLPAGFLWDLAVELCATFGSVAQRSTVWDAAESKDAWCPDECPITGLPFFMWIENESGVRVPTYGGPFDSYTIPERSNDVVGFVGFTRERFDHDDGTWVEGCESIDAFLVQEKDLPDTLSQDALPTNTETTT